MMSAQTIPVVPHTPAESFVDPGTAANYFGTTMQLSAQSDMESMRDAQGKFLEQLLGDRIHLLTEKVQ
jgi:hypothetical protein